MIELTNGKYRIECDGGCGAVNFTGQRSFHQARNVSEVEGWEHRGVRGVWHNYCPQCAETDPAVDLAGLHFFKEVADE
jgi:hypothetical protein